MSTRRFGRGLALALVALIFSLGIVVGVLGTHLFYAQRLRQPGAVADWVVDAGARQVASQLGLRPDQRRQLDVALEGTRAEVAELRRDLLERIREIRRSALAELLPILDAEQREQLRRIHETDGQYLDRYLEPSPPRDPGSVDP